MKRTSFLLILLLLIVLPIFAEDEYDVQVKQAVKIVLSILEIEDEVLVEVQTQVVDEILDARVKLVYQQRSSDFHVMEDLKDGFDAERLVNQLKNDIPDFLFEGVDTPMLDYVYKISLSSKSAGSRLKAGTCFQLGKDGVLIVRSSHGDVSEFNRFYAKAVGKGLGLTKRGMLNSLWAFGGYRSAGLGFISRIPGLYPLELVAEVSCLYTSQVLIEAGVGMELFIPLEVDFLANSRVLALVKAGYMTGYGFCSSYGLYFENSLSGDFSWRIGYERRNFESTDFKASLVWNI